MLQCRQVAALLPCCLLSGKGDRQNCRVAGTILRAPQALVEVLRRLAAPARQPAALLGLLGLGVLLGTSSGFITSLAIGWSPNGLALGSSGVTSAGAGASTALLPLCLFIFPSSFGASVFLIALSTWFPVTVLTWSE